MTTFSIKDLEHLSGIKAHTIRIWEQRYELITPSRTDTNIRYYSDKDLKLILNVSLLKENGFKISKIAQMSEGDMQREVIKLTDKNLKFPEQIHALNISMVDLDEDRFEKIISSSILKIGFEKTMLNIIYPFLSKIGILWQTGAINPAQEHFMSNLIRQKLIVAIDNQYNALNEGSKKFMLFLPEEELHELSLLFAAFIVKARKHKPIYLGQSLPLKDLEEVYHLHKPEFLITIATSNPGTSKIQAYVDTLSEMFPESTVLISGYQIVGQGIKTKDNVMIINHLQGLIEFIEDQTVTEERVSSRY
ncbi:MAG: MerR family transcriptional regulator [bacterium]|nr:MerR family transcriptional regulator [bacterium]